MFLYLLTDDGELLVCCVTTISLINCLSDIWFTNDDVAVLFD